MLNYFKNIASVSFILSITCWLPSTVAYEIDGKKWVGGKASFYVGIEGASLSEISWRSAVIEALAEWTEKTVFEFSAVDEYRDPCAPDFDSSIDFKDDVCGSEFGANVLAVALNTYELQELGPPAIDESDIIVNSVGTFDIYSGPIANSTVGLKTTDFRRVVLHELGHSIGLGHEEALPAVMAPFVSDIDSLQEDDIAGVEALYSGLSSCDVQRLAFGSSVGSLSSGDCTVKELTVGGSDDSYVDLYQFEVNHPTQFEFDANSDTLDTVLLLATTDLEYLAVETASVNDCNSTLSLSLEAGSYFLMVNTFDIAVKAECGVSGAYSLTAGFSSIEQPDLGSTASLLGSFSLAKFGGGISSDNGASFGNLFSATDSLDIAAEITIDASHVGQPGFLLVAAFLPGQLLMLNEQDQFVDIGSVDSELVIYRRKPLAETERLQIAEDLVPGQVGVFQLEANLIVGYGLDANPDEVYYHSTPMNLVVQPSVGGN